MLINGLPTQEASNLVAGLLPMSQQEMDAGRVAVDVLTPAEQKEREERLQAPGAEVPIDTFTTHLVGTLRAQADPGAVVDRYKLHAVAALAWPEWHFEVARG